MASEPLRITVKRQVTDGCGYTLQLDGGRLTITGGTYADSYAPVEIDVWAMEQLITDMRSLHRVGKREP